MRLNLILLGLFFTLTVFAQKQDIQLLKNQIENTIPEALTASKVPGVAIAIIENGKIILQKGYGYANILEGQKVNAQIGFNIGSISKTFTAWGIMKLKEQGKLKLDDPVEHYLTKWQFPSSKTDAKKITIRNLLEHSAGLNVHGYDGYETKENLPSLVDCLNGEKDEIYKVKMDTSANAIWKYSGGGYTILQLLIEEVSQTSFAEFMEKEIFVPLNMKYSSFDITNCIEKHSAQPYDEDGKAIPFRYFTAQAAAGLHTTLADLLHFFQASLNKNPVISQLSIQELIKPTTISNKKYGMGYMMINDFGNFTLIGHAGSNEGWQAVLLQDFATKSGIIMLTNGSNGKNVLFQGLKIWAKWRS